MHCAQRRKPSGRARAIAFIAFSLPSASACSPAHHDDPAFWEPASESTSEDDAGTSDDTATPSGVPCVEVRFTTAAPGGKYRPANVGAVWVVSETGTYVRTLALWGSKRAHHLVAWGAASGFDVVDAVTQATRKNHGPMTIAWDCLDRARLPVAAGPYSILVEMTDSNSGTAGSPAGVHTMFPVVLGGASETRTLRDDPFFSARVLALHP